jgi:hypothetical protein
VDTPPPAEELVLAMATGLLRKGLIDETDIEDMCAGLSEDVAHQLRCCVLEASAPSQAEWAAGQARERFRVIEGGGE